MVTGGAAGIGRGVTRGSEDLHRPAPGKGPFHGVAQWANRFRRECRTSFRTLLVLHPFQRLGLSGPPHKKPDVRRLNLFTGPPRRALASPWAVWHASIMGPSPPSRPVALDRHAYRAGSPWHHLVVDGTFDPDLVARAASFIENLPDAAFVWYRTRRLRRGTLSDQEGMGEAARSLCSACTSDEFVEDLGALTRIDGLEADPRLTSAGVYITPPGGWHSVHQDPPRHPLTGRWSRVAVLLYLSDWQTGDGGELELWPEDKTMPPTIIEPRPGRMVIFAPTAQTRHGIRRSSCDRRRIALSLRYYSAQSPSVLPRFHERWRFGIYGMLFRLRSDAHSLRRPSAPYA